MTTIAEVYEAIRDRLDTIPGLRVKDHVPGATEFPVAFPEPPVVVTDNLTLETATLTVDLVVLVSAFEERRQKDLLKYQDLTGTHSLLALFQANRNLGFADVDVYAGSWRPLALVEMSYYRAYGAACGLMILLGDC